MSIKIGGIECTLADGVRETTQTTSTGTYSLDGAATVDGITYRTFAAGIGNGERTVYVVRMGDEFEVGIGTVTAGSPSTLSRDTILASSNNNNAVNWGPGIKDVTLAPVAAMFDALQSAIDSLESDLGDAESAISALQTLLSAITKDGSNQYTIDPGANNRTALSVRNATGSPGANVLAFQITSAGVGKIEVRDATGAAKITLEGANGGELSIGGNQVHALSAGLGAPAEITSTSEVDFTDIRDDAIEIVVMLKDVSTSGNDHLLVQIGTSGTPATTGYVATGLTLNAQANQDEVSATPSTAGFIIRGGVAAATRTGSMVLRKFAGNTWHAEYVMGTEQNDDMVMGWGAVTLGGPLDIVRITTSGTDSLDAGEVNILVK